MLYRKTGQPDNAAILLDRVARAVETSNEEITVLLLEKAAETVETENRPFQAASYTSKLLAMALRRNDLRSAVDRVRKLVALFQVSPFLFILESSFKIQNFKIFWKF